MPVAEQVEVSVLIRPPVTEQLSVALAVLSYILLDAVTDTVTGALLTVKVKLCVAFGNTPLLAVNVIVYGGPAFGPVVERFAHFNDPVPSPLSTNCAPLGTLVALIEGVGDPVVVTVNEPGFVP
ncbi:hypothetical protein AUG19_02095 [archaeon 13_1_20CM_2_54_9]|nr:MAG: hypothetical protein AUG19_02095 [archaeon 13_1_20CM_2_54_9]